MIHYKVQFPFGNFKSDQVISEEELKEALKEGNVEKHEKNIIEGFLTKLPKASINYNLDELEKLKDIYVNSFSTHNDEHYTSDFTLADDFVGGFINWLKIEDRKPLLKSF